ncbi:hypothetical protein [Peribacillus sp. NPDC097225]|uniref:hypothetical protein n=1 Tax=Peribacillus sp. NPDC097225 TaxID=3364400 RepID=UPI003826C69A
MQIWVRYSHLGIEREVPLEWLRNEELVNDIIIFIEYLFIYQGKFVGNNDGKDKRKRKTNYRKWEDYFPDENEGIFIVLDPSINSPFLKEEGKIFWTGVSADLYVEYLTNQAKLMYDYDTAEYLEEWE